MTPFISSFPSSVFFHVSKWHIKPCSVQPPAYFSRFHPLSHVCTTHLPPWGFLKAPSAQSTNGQQEQFYPGGHLSCLSFTFLTLLPKAPSFSLSSIYQSFSFTFYLCMYLISVYWTLSSLKAGTVYIWCIPLSPLSAWHTVRAHLTFDQWKKLISTVDCSVDQPFPIKTLRALDGATERQSRWTQDSTPTWSGEVLQRSDLDADLHIEVYFENKHSTCKVCSIKFKHRKVEGRISIIKGHCERIWKTIELFGILTVAVIPQLCAFVKTHRMY